jgi:tRNA (guanine37-N1)-methyltransferase
MRYTIITTQKDLYNSFLTTGLIARGIDQKIIDIKIHSLYDYATDTHHSIDDAPYGGGAGMVLRVDLMDRALAKLKIKNKKTKVILLTPQGKRFDQKMAKRLAKEKELILVAGRFEGYDERIRQLCDEEISLGDYILTAGDLPTMVLIDTISRQIPGFIDRKESIEKESFAYGHANNLLEYPQYTRPFEYRGKKVPKILLSGNHAAVEEWRNTEAQKRTHKRRKDLHSDI